MPTTVLGLIGPAQSGKDTFAQRLIERYGFTRVAFADTLKAVAYDLDTTVVVHPSEVGLVRNAIGSDFGAVTIRLQRLVDLVGWDVAKQLREVRGLLQRLGTAVRDNADRDIWLNAAKAEVDAAHGPVVITDVRYFNEADWIADRLPGGYLVRVSRSVSQERNALAEELAGHASETELAAYPADFTVYNDSSIPRLHRQADTLARVLALDPHPVSTYADLADAA